MRVFRAESMGFHKAFLGGVFGSLTERGRSLIGLASPAPALEAPQLAELGELLLSRRGEASGVALAGALLAAYANALEPERRAFLRLLASRFGPDPAKVEQAITRLHSGAPGAIEQLHAVSEPRRQELFRRINMAPGGTRTLLSMREDLLAMLPSEPDLQPVNADFAHLFISWFNRGFLSLRQIDWNTPASILEKIIRYEAVHQIRNWDDLRNRLQPPDRRCYAFFHPQLPDEPLIFVEVALTTEVSDAVAPLLDLSRAPIPAETATTAVFYSISNTQRGLAGVSFGNFLIKQVVELLKSELPGVRNFVTLSPVPGFANWLRARAAANDPEAKAALAAREADPAQAAGPEILHLAARYFLTARNGAGLPVDPVARFHLGNGARLERLNPGGDRSPNGLRQSFGLMVNYLYAPEEIERNHEAFVESSRIAASPSVRRALPDQPAAPPSPDSPRTSS